MTPAVRRLFLAITLFTFFSNPADAAYPRYRYIVTPLARLSEVPGPANEVFDKNTVSVSFQIERRPGSLETFWMYNVSFEEYQEYLKSPAPALEGPVEDRVRALIRKVKENPHATKETLEHVKELSLIIGPLRSMSTVEAINVFPDEALFAMAGVAPDSEKPKQVLALRRFGVLRRRGPKWFEGAAPDLDSQLQRVLAPLVRDRYAHLVVGDIVTPLVPSAIPTPVQFYSESRMSEFFDPAHLSLLLAWGVTSEDAFDLSFRAFADQMKSSTGETLSEETLAAMRKKTGELDLSRLFFYVIEDFAAEKALQTLSFIDGGKVDDDYYELPVESQNKDIKFREIFAGEELFEIRGLAIDSELRGLKDSPINTEAWAAQLLDFIENASHQNSRFLLRAYSGPARLYRQLLGYTNLDPNADYNDPKKIHIMHAKGSELVSAIYKRYPHLKKVLVHDMPNRFNRRQPSYDTDHLCLNRLRSFGHDL